MVNSSALFTVFSHSTVYFRSRFLIKPTVCFKGRELARARVGIPRYRAIMCVWIIVLALEPTVARPLSYSFSLLVSYATPMFFFSFLLCCVNHCKIFPVIYPRRECTLRRGFGIVRCWVRAGDFTKTPRMKEEQQQHQEGRGFPGTVSLIVTALTHVLLLAPVIYIVALYIEHYQFFSWHPICMSVGVSDNQHHLTLRRINI